MTNTYGYIRVSTREQNEERQLILSADKSRIGLRCCDSARFPQKAAPILN